jgi:hypothetical protein
MFHPRARLAPIVARCNSMPVNERRKTKNGRFSKPSRVFPGRSASSIPMALGMALSGFSQTVGAIPCSTSEANFDRIASKYPMESLSGLFASFVTIEPHRPLLCSLPMSVAQVKYRPGVINPFINWARAGVGEAGTGQLVDVDSDVGLLGLLFCVRGALH